MSAPKSSVVPGPVGQPGEAERPLDPAVAGEGGRPSSAASRCEATCARLPATAKAHAAPFLQASSGRHGARIAAAFRPHHAGRPGKRKRADRRRRHLLPGLRRRALPPAARSCGGASYAEQLSALLDRCFGTSDAYSAQPAELGHEAVDLLGQLPRASRPPGPASTGRRWRRGWRRALPTRLGVAARSRFLHRVARAQIAAARSGGGLPPGPVVLPAARSSTRCERRAGWSSARSRAAPPGLEVLQRLRPDHDVVPALRRALPRRRDRQRVLEDRLRRARARAARRGAADPAGAARHARRSFVGGVEPDRPSGRAPRCSSGSATRGPSTSGATAPTSCRRARRSSTLPRRGLGPGDVRGARAVADRDQPAHRRRRGLRQQHAAVRGDRCGRAAVDRGARRTSQSCSRPARRSSPTTSEDELVEKIEHYLEHDERAGRDRGGRPGAHACRAHLRGSAWRELAGDARGAACER